MNAAFRGFSSTLTAIMLLAAVLGGECASCGIGTTASSEKNGCCDPEGRCKASQHKAPPARCLKAHVNAALIEQVAQGHPAIVHFDLSQPIEPLARQDAAAASAVNWHSPPDLLILNSALLI